MYTTAPSPSARAPRPRTNSRCGRGANRTPFCHPFCHAFFPHPVSALLYLQEKDSLALALELAGMANDTKAVDIRVLNVQKLVFWTRYFVVATCFSKPQVNACISRMEDAAAEKFGRVLKNSPAASSWVCLDFGCAGRCAALRSPRLCAPSPAPPAPCARVSPRAVAPAASVAPFIVAVKKNHRRPFSIPLHPRCPPCSDVVAHVFTPGDRDAYDLEGLYMKSTEARKRFPFSSPRESGAMASRGQAATLQNTIPPLRMNVERRAARTAAPPQRC